MYRAPRIDLRVAKLTQSILFAWMLLVLAAGRSRAAPADEIHWTVMGQTAVSFDWRGASDTLQFGLTPAYDHLAIGTVPSPYPISSAGPFWEARLGGLTENTLYHYSIAGSPDHTFKTPPPRGASDFSVMVEGDIGDSTSYKAMPLVQALIASRHPDLVLITGDITYGNHHGQATVDHHFHDVMAWSQDAPYMPVWGNAEWDFPAGDDLRNYKGRFDLPNPRTSPSSPAVSCCGEDWYWFDYGNVRFIAYAERWPGAYKEWYPHAAAIMDSAQADPAIDYIVTFGHRPAYTAGHYAPGELDLRAYLDSLGAGHSKYVLNLTGHDHGYQRSLPQHGVVHITAGTGGGGLYPITSAAWQAVHLSHLGAFRLHVTHAGIEGTMLCGPANSAQDLSCPSGSVIDSFFIANPSARPRPDRPPWIAAPDSVRGSEGTPLRFQVAAGDSDGDSIDSLRADLSGLPAGDARFDVSQDQRSGSLSWTPTPADVPGPYTVTFRAWNRLTGPPSSTAITVGTQQRTPVLIATADTAIAENALLRLTVQALDPDGDPIHSLSADLSGLPADAQAAWTPATDARSGILTWTPSYDDSGGPYRVLFTARNDSAATETTTIRVTNVDRPPTVVVAATASASEGVPFALGVVATDPDGDAITSLTADLSGLPAGNNAVFTPNSSNTAGTLMWTPQAGDTGPYTMTFIASNAQSGSASTQISAAPAQANLVRNPGFESGLSGWANKGDTTFTRVAGGHTGGFCAQATLTTRGTFGIHDSPHVVASVKAGTHYHLSTWVRSPSSRGLAKIKVREYFNGAQQGSTALSGGLALSPTWQQVTLDCIGHTSGSYLDVELDDFAVAIGETLQVDDIVILSGAGGAPDQAPLVQAPPAASVNENGQLTLNVTAQDPDGQAISSLNANLSGLPAGNDAVFTPNGSQSAGTLTWTPTFADGRAQAYTVTFTASNTLGGTASTAITVDNVDRAPVVTAPVTRSALSGSMMTLGVTAADPDGDSIAGLTANLAGLPAGSDAVFTPNGNQTAGTLTWTPTHADQRAAPYNVTFIASNGQQDSATTAIVVGSGAAVPPVSYVGRVASGASSGVSASKAIIATRAVNAGDAVLVAVLLGSTAATGTPSVADRVGNSYVLNRDQTDGSAHDRMLMFSALNAKPLAVGDTIVLTYPRSRGCHASIDEFTALMPADRSASAFATGTSFNSGATLTTTQPSELLFGLVGNESGVAPTWAPGWSALPTLSIGNDRLTTAYQIVNAAGAYAASGTLTGTWMAGIVTFATPTPVTAPPLAASAVAASTAPATRPDARVVPSPIVERGALEFTMVRPGPVEVDLFDVRGRRVSTPPLAWDWLGAGPHRQTLVRDARSLAGGVYFYRLRTPDGVLKGRFVVLR